MKEGTTEEVEIEEMWREAKEEAEIGEMWREGKEDRGGRSVWWRRTKEEVEL